ncbi:MAG: hypothetical protein PHT33_15050, partial [bacterium]|nr:hypothetical protein [bacterium]
MLYKFTRLLISALLFFYITPVSTAFAGMEDGISLDVKGMKVDEVVRVLAADSDANIIIGDGVDGKVTLAVKDMSLEEILDLIIQSVPSLTWVKKEKPHQVYEIKVAGDMEFYRLKYAKMEDVGALLGFFVARNDEAMRNIANVANNLSASLGNMSTSRNNSNSTANTGNNNATGNNALPGTLLTGTALPGGNAASETSSAASGGSSLASILDGVQL